MTLFQLTRREAIKLFGLSAGALVLGAKTKTPASGGVLNHFVSINTDNTVSIVCQRSEMGQGIRTALPMVIADELDVDWNSVRVVQAPGDAKYGDQNTDGSVSIQNNWMTARQMGASARAMLIAAAAQGFKCKEGDLETELGFVRLKHTGDKLSYGSLALVASRLPVPKTVKLKDESTFRIIGKPIANVDANQIVSGKAIYSIDVELPDMLIASIERCPVIGGGVKSYDAANTLKVPGVKSVIELAAQPQSINTQASVAVLATNTYAALQGRTELKVEWDLTHAQTASDQERLLTLQKALEVPGKIYRENGNVDEAKGTAFSADYYCPYLAHASMEPPCAMARVTNSGCEVWAPSQDPQRLRTTIAKHLNLPEATVTVHVVLAGGAFGRKCQTDFTLEAVMLSQKSGRPVKVVWSREDDIRHDFYHADSLQRLKVKLDPAGYPVSWEWKTAFPTCNSVFEAGALNAGDWELNFGATNMPYDIPNVRVSHCPVQSPVRVGWLRSVQNLFHAFAANIFIDELAERAGIDPVAYRLQLLQRPRMLENDVVEQAAALKQNTARLAAVIRRAAEVSEWNKTQANKGFASHYSFCSYTAAVAQVNIVGQEIQVKRVELVVDCGRMINPDTVESQMQGAVVFGISAALFGAINLDNGRVRQSSFHDYPVLRMGQCPDIRIHLTQSSEPPSGVGEAGVPSIAPAIANAVYKATGKRLRSLPLSL